MIRASGQWSNAPVVYVLAQVRTERLADLKSYQEKFAARLRDDGYPIQREMHAAKLVTTGANFVFEPEQESAWEFATPDNQTGVILRSTGLVLHATYYEDEAEFLSRLDKVTTLFEKEIPSVYVNRIGMRYVDFVLPKAGEELGAYMDKRLNPDLGLAKAAGMSAATNVAIYPMGDKRQLIVRYSCGRGKPQIPPDLGMLALKPSRLMEESIDDSRTSAVLDTDCGIEYSPVQKLDAGRVKEDFGLIYKDLFEAFTTAITAHAKRAWGAK